MSKIYEALRRHEALRQPEKESAKSILSRDSLDSHAPFVRALESMYPIVQRLATDVGRGIVLHFVAATQGEGASTLSNEFAMIASRMAESRVLLLDADKAQLTTAGRYGCENDFGVLGQVQAGTSIEQMTVATADNASLHVGLLAGRHSPPVSRKAMSLLYNQLRDKYDITIIDCPAIFSDRYLELSPEAADGIVFVVQAERNRPEIFARHNLRWKTEVGNSWERS